MQFKVVNVTPAIAARWLKQNGLNRKKSTAHIKRLADKMAQGRWITNGQTISFDIDGKLIDGQHRLEAIVLSGATIEHAVALDVADPKAFTTYDGDALKRGAAQVAEMMGATHGRELVASARVIHLYENSKDMEQFAAAVGRSGEFSNEQLAEYSLSLSDEYANAYEMIGSFAKRTSSRSIFIALVMIFDRIDPVATSEFCRKLRTGVFSSENDPCLLLRDRLLTESKLKGTKWKRTMAAITIKAFNYHMDGKPLSSLRWRIEGDNPERFPVIKGGKK